MTMVRARDLSQRQKVKNVLERVGALEQGIQGLASGIEQIVTRLNDKITRLAEILDAVTTEVGSDRIQQLIDNKRVERAREALRVAVAEGRYAKVETIGETSLVVCHEEDETGATLPPGRLQIDAPRLVKDVKDVFLGKGTGASYTYPNTKVRVVVDEVYDPREPQPAEVPPAVEATPEALHEIQEPVGVSDGS